MGYITNLLPWRSYHFREFQKLYTCLPEELPASSRVAWWIDFNSAPHRFWSETEIEGNKREKRWVRERETGCGCTQERKGWKLCERERENLYDEGREYMPHTFCWTWKRLWSIPSRISSPQAVTFRHLTCLQQYYSNQKNSLTLNFWHTNWRKKKFPPNLQNRFLFSFARREREREAFVIPLEEKNVNIFQYCQRFIALEHSAKEYCLLLFFMNGIFMTQLSVIYVLFIICI